jgi:hypothetical protein
VWESTTAIGAARLTALAIAARGYERHDGWTFTRAEVLAGDAGLSVRSVLRSIDELLELGEVEMCTSTESTRGRSNAYRAVAKGARSDKLSEPGSDKLSELAAPRTDILSERSDKSVEQFGHPVQRTKRNRQGTDKGVNTYSAREGETRRKPDDPFVWSVVAHYAATKAAERGFGFDYRRLQRLLIQAVREGAEPFAAGELAGLAERDKDGLAVIEEEMAKGADWTLVNRAVRKKLTEAETRRRRRGRRAKTASRGQ